MEKVDPIKHVLKRLRRIVGSSPKQGSQKTLRVVANYATADLKEEVQGAAWLKQGYGRGGKLEQRRRDRREPRCECKFRMTRRLWCG